MSEAIFAEVRQLVADVFNVPLEQVTADASPSTINAWDSLQQLNLVLALEQNFGLAFLPEEIEKMQSVSSIVDILSIKQSV
jgi:acyl carrier protein